MSVKRFPVLMNRAAWLRHPSCPRTVPWGWLEPHARQARINHDQSLETLARRGGLDPLEMTAVMDDRRYGYAGGHDEALKAAVARLVAMTDRDGSPEPTVEGRVDQAGVNRTADRRS